MIDFHHIMNDIVQKQNKADFIDMLCAQRFAYSKAKNFFMLRLIISLIILVISTILIINFSTISIYIVLVLFFYTFFDFIILRNIENGYRINGSKIQELFDTELFKIPWNSLISQEKPEKETIFLYSNKFKEKNSTESLNNWYPVDIQRLNLNQAIVVCQRTNIWWDITLRKYFLTTLIVFILLITFIIIFLFTTSSQIVWEMLFSFIPLYEILIDYSRSQYDSINKKTHLKKFAEKNIESVISGNEVAVSEIRNLQDEIYRHREITPFVPDWFYFIFKDEHENQMNYSAKHYVEKILE
jgi:hypothetical protein